MVKVISMQNNLSFLKLCQIWKSDIFWRNLQSPPLVRISSSADFSFSHFSALEEDPLYFVFLTNKITLLEFFLARFEIIWSYRIP